MTFIDNFLDYISLEKRYSINTSESYKTDLEQFHQFIQEVFSNDDLLTCDHNMIRSWVISLMDQNFSPATINRKISTLKAFFKFLHKTELIDRNPSSKIIPIKNSKKLPEFIESKNIINVLDESIEDKDFDGILELLILEFLYGTGIRQSELLNLKMSNLEINKKEVRVLGKGNKERIIPLNTTLLHLLTEYLNKKNDLEGNKTDFLFVKQNNERISKSYIYRTVKKKLNEINTQSKTSPHVLRHTFATHLLNNGADLNSIKELLGHSSLASTQVYTHNDLEKIKKAFRQAHPKA